MRCYIYNMKQSIIYIVKSWQYYFGHLLCYSTGRLDSPQVNLDSKVAEQFEIFSFMKIGYIGRIQI